jgi:sulfate adenylyltransferase subunit 2
MHVDTGHNFPEVIEFRDRRCRASSAPGWSSPRCRTPSTRGRRRGDRPRASRNRLQTTTLLDAIEEHGFDAVFGGARRDEEKARAKERVFSFRDEFGQWDPKNQRPELWSLYNGRHRKGEHIRVFPLSTGPSSTSGSTSRARTSRSRRSTSPTSARCSSATACCSPSGVRAVLPTASRLRHGALPHGRRHDLHRRRRVDGATTVADEVIAEVAATRITERGATRADDRVSEAGHGGPQEGEGYF